MKTKEAILAFPFKNYPEYEGFNELYKTKKN